MMTLDKMWQAAIDFWRAATMASRSMSSRTERNTPLHWNVLFEVAICRQSD